MSASWTITFTLALSVATLVESIVAPAARAQSDPADALVLILADRRSYGTGFFVGPDGTVLTAYHVVQGARSIVVVHRAQTLRDVIVEAYAPEYDLARLKVRDLTGPSPHVKLASGLPPGAADEELRIFGHGTGLRDQRHVTRMTTRGYRLSREFSAPGARPLFARDDVRLIPLEAPSIYDGTSGGPLVSRHGVMGVLSGSLGQGGTLAWAIPIEYAQRMRPVNRQPADIPDWPPLALMAPGTRTLRRSVQTASAIQTRLDEYLQAVSAYRDRSQELDTAARRALPAITFARHAVARARSSNQPVAMPAIEMYEERTKEFSASSDATAVSLKTVGTQLKDLLTTIDRDRTLPRTQHNARIMAGVESKIRDVDQKLGGQIGLLEREDRDTEALGVSMMDEATRARSGVAKLQAALDYSARIVSRAVTPEVVGARREIARLHRTLGELIESMLLAGLDSRGDAWRYKDDLGFEVNLPPGWELVPPELDDEIRKTPIPPGMEHRAAFTRQRAPDEGAYVFLTITSSEVRDGITEELLARERLGAAPYADATVRRANVAGRPAIEVFFTFRQENKWFRRYAIVLPLQRPRAVTLKCDIVREQAARLEAECGDLLRSVVVR